jgi:hypothetical protein
MATPIVVLLLALTLAALAAIRVLEEPGPSAPLVLLRRYGPWPALTGLATAAWVVGLIVAPALTTVATASLLAAAAAGCALLGWGPATWWRACRRITLRARWTSVARSSELAVQRDHRVPGVGADSATLTDIVRLEWTPTIRRGRALPGSAGVTYQLRPARGSSIPEIAERAERLAAGLHVAAIEIEPIRPDLAHLTVRWH